MTSIYLTIERRKNEYIYFNTKWESNICKQLVSTLHDKSCIKCSVDNITTISTSINFDFSSFTMIFNTSPSVVHAPIVNNSQDVILYIDIYQDDFGCELPDRDLFKISENNC